MMMADHGRNPHDMIHVGMGDEDGIHRFDDPLGQMGDLAAVEEQRPSQGADPEEEEGVVQQAAEKGRFDEAEGEALSIGHGHGHGHGRWFYSSMVGLHNISSGKYTC
jgi:hypothetical protein